MFFRCRVCEEKNKRLADLQSQLDTLRELLLPRGTEELPRIALEADAVLTPSNDSPILSDDEYQSMEQVQSEATRLFAGNY